MNKIHEKLALVPLRSGVYLMRDEGGRIIYIGKAKSLRNRLSSYFKSGSHDAKVTAMVAKVVDFDYFITRTENDALALEANLIKRHSPHYNILLKDSKSFPYIRIAKGAFPMLEVTRKTKGVRADNYKYFGPYFNGIWARELLEVVRDIFPLRTCNEIEFRRKKPCVNYQIERCSAPCDGKISKEDYAKVIDDVGAFLRGEKEFGAREILMKKMENAAELEQFELAIHYRNGLNFLDKLKDRTIVEVARDLNCDVFAHVIKGEIFVVSVLTIRAGKLIGMQNFSEVSKGVEDESEMLSSFIMQYYQTNVVPELLLMENIDNELAETLGCKVYAPKIALKKKLLDMAITNAQEFIDTSIEKIKHKHEFTMGACEQLGEVLGMEKAPRKIECYDISHTAGEDVVASMVVFIDGVAQNKLYRRFKIRHGMGNDDYLSIQEVIKRRLARLGSTEDSFGSAPDLIVIDGGKGQLSAATSVNDTDIKFIALAEQNEEIFVQGQSEPIILSKRSYALRLLQRLRDEAHRFANSFHIKKRSQSKIPL
ncbi:MAG: excinuclease ABC subunit UvrC [Firmicutes bacterium]|nr:excinuclease ABC subunit UvrC [Bacillota bacterium]